MLIDDFSSGTRSASNGCDWQLFSDQVMGGVSAGSLESQVVDNRGALRLQGDVSLANNGGFIQMSLDILHEGEPFNATAFTGFECDVLGNTEDYNVHLRTNDTTRPWQSYRQTFRATRSWKRVQLPFADFLPHRIESPLDTKHLRRISFSAIGRKFTANLSVSHLAMY